MTRHASDLRNGSSWFGDAIAAVDEAFAETAMISPGDDTLTAALQLAAELQHRPGEVDQRVGEWMQDHLRRGAGAGTLSEALGLDNRAEIVRARRDALLREVALTLPAWSANRIAGALARYHADRWPRARLELRCPHPAASLEAKLWNILRVWPAVLSAKQIDRLCPERHTFTCSDVPRPDVGTAATR